MDKYIGSVRFYKHIFLGICVLLIVIPTVLITLLVAKNVYGEKETESAPEILPTATPSQSIIDEPEPTPMGTAEKMSYTSLYPDLYVEPEEIVPVEEKTVYLTFDDGPSECTGKVLDILKEHEIKATFFVVGNQLNDERGQQLLRRIHEEGHTIGLHSDTHDYRKVYESVESFLDDFAAVDQKVFDITGVHSKIFRFPGGSINTYNSALYEQIIGEMVRRGYTYFDWNAATGDASVKKVSKKEIISNAVSTALGHDQVVLLLHDSTGKENTVAGLPEIIKQLTDNGYQFAPLEANVRPVIFGYRK